MHVYTVCTHTGSSGGSSSLSRLAGCPGSFSVACAHEQPRADHCTSTPVMPELRPLCCGRCVPTATSLAPPLRRLTVHAPIATPSCLTGAASMPGVVPPAACAVATRFMKTTRKAHTAHRACNKVGNQHGTHASPPHRREGEVTWVAICTRSALRACASRAWASASAAVSTRLTRALRSTSAMQVVLRVVPTQSSFGTERRAHSYAWLGGVDHLPSVAAAPTSAAALASATFSDGGVAHFATLCCSRACCRQQPAQLRASPTSQQAVVQCARGNYRELSLIECLHAPGPTF